MFLNNSEGWKEDRYCLGLLIIRFFKKNKTRSTQFESDFEISLLDVQKNYIEIKVRFELKFDSN